MVLQRRFSLLKDGRREEEKGVKDIYSVTYRLLRKPERPGLSYLDHDPVCGGCGWGNIRGAANIARVAIVLWNTRK